MKPSRREEKVCEYCGDRFEGRAIAKFCSTSCRTSARNEQLRTTTTCIRCGTKFVHEQSVRRKYCSRECFKADRADGNVKMATNTLVMDGRNNIVVSESDHLIALVGLHDLVVVHGEDATLICPRGYEERIKELTDLRRREFGDRFE